MVFLPITHCFRHWHVQNCFDPRSSTPLSTIVQHARYSYNRMNPNSEVDSKKMKKMTIVIMEKVSEKQYVGEHREPMEMIQLQRRE